MRPGRHRAGQRERDHPGGDQRRRRGPRQPANGIWKPTNRAMTAADDLEHAAPRPAAHGLARGLAEPVALDREVLELVVEVGDLAPELEQVVVGQDVLAVGRSRSSRRAYSSAPLSGLRAFSRRRAASSSETGAVPCVRMRDLLGEELVLLLEGELATAGQVEQRSRQGAARGRPVVHERRAGRGQLGRRRRHQDRRIVEEDRVPAVAQPMEHGPDDEDAEQAGPEEQAHDRIDDPPALQRLGMLDGVALVDLGHRGEQRAVEVATAQERAACRSRRSPGAPRSTGTGSGSPVPRRAGPGRDAGSRPCRTGSPGHRRSPSGRCPTGPSGRSRPARPRRGCRSPA